MKETVQMFLDVFPGSQILGQANPQRGKLVSLGCTYKNEFRGVNSEVCKWHLSEKDPFCLGECENLWVAKNLKEGGKTT